MHSTLLTPCVQAFCEPLITTAVLPQAALQDATMELKGVCMEGSRPEADAAGRVRFSLEASVRALEMQSREQDAELQVSSLGMYVALRR